MAIIPLYRDVARILDAIPAGQAVWPRFEEEVYYPHRAYFEGLIETYGPDAFGPDGLAGAIERSAPALRQHLRHSATYGMEEAAHEWQEFLGPRLPGTAPNLYLGTLLFTAPAATISVLGRPTIALGLERFQPVPPAEQPMKYWYHPYEVVEMLPHEAAHAARMQVLDLPATPRKLSLLDMVMLEGTALTFTDQLLGRQTLATFLPAQHLAWLQANDAAVRAAIAPDYARHGMEIFLKYFSPGSTVSGYYVGYSLCSEYLRRHGTDAMRRLLVMPSAEILSVVSR